MARGREGNILRVGSDAGNGYTRVWKSLSARVRAARSIARVPYVRYAGSPQLQRHAFLGSLLKKRQVPLYIQQWNWRIILDVLSADLLRG